MIKAKESLGVNCYVGSKSDCFRGEEEHAIHIRTHMNQYFPNLPHTGFSLKAGTLHKQCWDINLLDTSFISSVLII